MCVYVYMWRICIGFWLMSIHFNWFWLIPEGPWCNDVMQQLPAVSIHVCFSCFAMWACVSIWRICIEFHGSQDILLDFQWLQRGPRYNGVIQQLPAVWIQMCFNFFLQSVYRKDLHWFQLIFIHFNEFSLITHGPCTQLPNAATACPRNPTVL